MSAENALSVCLVGHANAVLERRAAPELVLGAGAARFCESIRFVGTEVAQLAEDPPAFYAVLGERNVTRVKLRRVARTDGFGPLVIDAGDAGTFRAKWSLGDRSRADQRIWRVSYTEGREPVAPPPDGLEPCRARLTSVLEEIAAFAENEKLTPFDGMFRRALRLLGDAAVDDAMVPLGLFAPAAQRTASAALAAWVFGGMGSWNDLGWDDHPDFRRLTEALYRAIFEVLESAANAG